MQLKCQILAGVTVSSSHCLLTFDDRLVVTTLIGE
jgi:hypothetical protein